MGPKSKDRLSTFFRVLFGPVVFAALLVALGVTAACGSDDPATATSTNSASQPTATATATATPATEPTPTPAPTETPLPQPTATLTPTPVLVASPTPTPAPPLVMLKDLACTQLFLGAYDPDGQRSNLSLSAKLVNTGDEDVPVRIGVFGGAIIFAEFFDESGASVTVPDTTLHGVTKLEPDVEHDISISIDLYDSTSIGTCEFGILAEDSGRIQLSGESSAEVEQVYAP